MAEHRLGTGESLSPDLIAQRAFTTNRKGFDPSEVKTFLASVADTVRDLREQIRISEAARRSAEERALHPKIDEEMLLSAVGEETTSILRTARAAAGDIRAKAEEQAATLLRDAQSKAETITGEAEAAAVRLGSEAEEEAGALRAKVAEEAERIRVTARREAEAVRQLADQERKMTVEAAQQIREQILSDLTRRRRVANTQIEQLRAGRERLLDAYVVVRRTLDEVTDELQRADGEARQAAEEVAKRAAARPSDDLLLDLTPTGPVSTPLPIPAAEHLDEPTAVFEVIRVETDDDDEEGDEDTDGDEDGNEDSAPVGEASDRAPVAGGPMSDRPDSPPVERPRRSGTRSVPTPAQGTQVVEALDDLESVRLVRAGTAPRGTAPGVTGSGGTASGGTVVAPARTERPKSGSRRGPATARAPQEDRAPEPVDSVFARIRADRADAEVKAGRVLGEAGEQTVGTDQTAATEAGTAETGASEAGAPEAGAPEAGAPEAGAPEVVDEEPISDGDEGYLQRRDEATAEIEVALARRLKRALQDEQNDVLDRLRQVRGTPKAANLLPKPADQRSRYTTASRPHLEEAARAGVAYAAVFEPGEAAATTPPNVDDLAVALAAAVSEPLRRRLQQAFAESAGDDQQVLIEALGAVYREYKTQRIEQLAGDHVTGAFARGAYEATPDGMRLRWLAEDLGGPCPDCDDNVLAGGLPKGEEYPTGQTYPPAHAGCRCVLVPSED